VTLTTRRATLADAEQLALHVNTGFASYRSFAPEGWEPPPPAGELAHTRDLLGESGTWGLIACVDGEPAGHVAFFPARERGADGMAGNWRTRPLIPAVAHLWQLFVLPPWWGTGVAHVLHDAAIAEMRNRRFERARLFTPSGQARARRFYERRGWTLAGEAMNPGLRFAVAEYWLTLSP
jgi:GNAT superfamily N-acetyltransferase